MFWTVPYALLLTISILLYKYFPSSKVVRITIAVFAITVFANGFILGFTFNEVNDFFAKFGKGLYVGFTGFSIYAILLFSMKALRANEKYMDDRLETIINRLRKDKPLIK